MTILKLLINMSLILLLCGGLFAANETITQSITYEGETIMLRLTKENLRSIMVSPS